MLEMMHRESVERGESKYATLRKVLNSLVFMLQDSAVCI